MHRLGGHLHNLITLDLVRRVTHRYLRDHKRRRAVRKVARRGEDFVVELHRDLITGRIRPGAHHWARIGGNGSKERIILIPPVRDAIAASCLVEVFCTFAGRRLYPKTFCNRRGYGGAMLANKLSAHLVRDRPTYFVKADIRKCFDSIRHDDAIDYIHSIIKNRQLAEMIVRLAIPPELIGAGRGVPIGNGLSHHLANGILSRVWFRGRRLPGVAGLYAYMDDFIITGNNRRKLARASEAIGRMLAELGLAYKYPPTVSRCTEGVDLVGYRFYPDGRRRLRRKTYRRAARAARSHNPRRAAAYLGMAEVAHDRPLVSALRRVIGQGEKHDHRNQ